MKRKYKGWLAMGVGLVAVSLVLFLWLGGRERVMSEGVNEKLTVAATIFPLADIVRQVGGEAVEVELMIPPGASPHSYKLVPQQVSDLQSVELLFAIGHGLDDQLVHSAEAVSEAEVVIVDREIDLREFGEKHDKEEKHNDHEHDEGSVDPHYWLTVPNAQRIAKTVAEKLSQIDQDKSDLYERNLVEYLRVLEDLESDLQQLSVRKGQKNIVTMHDAFAYLAEQYGFEIVASYEPKEGQQPSINELRDLGEIIDRLGIKIFYTEPQKAATSATRFLQTEFGVEIGVLDPLGGVSNRDNYVGLMRANLEALTR